ncbi:MAG: hypothetical protein PHT16_03595 [Candidatus Pacebacteria bacterium]|nr:hypothetical protein [Candidatus Paceibacterota bacterium]
MDNFFKKKNEKVFRMHCAGGRAEHSKFLAKNYVRIIKIVFIFLFYKKKLFSFEAGDG